MRVLALETSGRSGSIASFEGNRDGPADRPMQIVGQVALPGEQRTAQSLLPAIGALLAQCQWEAKSIDLVCVATGPGSFTGLRIGVTTAKTFAYAAGADLVGLHTLAVLAAGIEQTSGRLWAILDAQRQELFAACFALPGEAKNPATQIVSIESWLNQLQPGDTIVGPPLVKLRERLPNGVQAVAEKFWQPCAIAVGQLGIVHYSQGKKSDPMQLVPQYFRKSAAEEKAEQAALASSATTNCFQSMSNRVFP